MGGQQGDLLNRLSAAMAVAMSEDQRQGLVGFVGRLLQWNARINLTGARTADELVGEHLPDSFALARLVPEGAQVLDVGSGGGLPAIPFSILRPDCAVTLVEPRAKRAAFLRTAVREGRLPQVRVEGVRLEEIEGCSAFDVGVSRATFPPPEWLRAARPYVRSGGRVMVLAARTEVAEPGEYDLVDELSYRTDAGHQRWVGAYVPRGTLEGFVPRGTSPSG